MENSTDLRVASFSYYLKPHEGKVNVFSADEFSNTNTGYHAELPKQAVLDPLELKPHMFVPRTPSISSEATSWSNSQSTLTQRSMSQAKLGGRAFGKKLLHGFTCAGPCTTKKAVYVREIIDMGSYGMKTDQFAFPVLKPVTTKKYAVETLTARKNGWEDEACKVEVMPRKSLEVFGSGTMKKGGIVKNLERKMSTLTWDAIPKAKDEPASTMMYESDVVSEASSDLFEIENISRSGSLVKQGSERTLTCMSPSTQYAPSEASIEWSVVTASTVEFSSAHSDCDEKYTFYTQLASGNKSGVAKKTQKTGLLGCKSHKSVKVAEPVYRVNEKSKH